MRRVAALLVALCALAACGGDRRPPRTSSPPRCRAHGIVAPGQKVPDCRFRTLDGGSLSLSSLRGKPLVLNFWASWCTFCVDEMPDFERARRRLEGKAGFVGANLLGVEGETVQAARRFAAKTGVRYPLLLDEGGSLYAHFSPRLLMPTTVFVDAQGTVRHRVFGPLRGKQLDDAMRTHLGVT